jgi:hypothetical protein
MVRVHQRLIERGQDIAGSDVSLGNPFAPFFAAEFEGTILLRICDADCILTERDFAKRIRETQGRNCNDGDDQSLSRRSLATNQPCKIIYQK